MKARKDFLKFIEDEGSETELIILDTIIEVQELIESQDESNYKYDDFMKFLNTLNCSIC